ncbi:MAG: DUF4380 domain-containing protein [Terriglobia bacterium]
MTKRCSLAVLLAIGTFTLASLLAPGRLNTIGPYHNALNPLSETIMMGSPANPYAARIEKAKYNGWDVTRLTNGLISLYVAPEIGGRAIQLELGGQGLFFVNKSLAGKVLPPDQDDVKSGWANYGGDKVWPAPEGWDSDAEWPSIPYYILDGSSFAFSIVKDTPAEVAVRVTSPKDARTGVQFERTYHVYAGTTRVTVDQVMKNISPRRIRWGIWHVLQNDAADANDPSKPNPALYMYIPVNPHSMFPKGYYIAYGDALHPSYQLVDDGRIMRVHYLYRVGKVALDSNAGWYAVVNGQKNLGYIETFKHFAGLEYPDNASVESWNDGAGTISRGPFFQVLPDDPVKTPYFLEAEVLSPFATLDPGEQYEFTVHWSPTSVTNPIVNAVWGGAVSRPLSAVVRGSQITLGGVFGVFVPGDLVANFYSSMGEITGEQTLEAVDPRHVVRLGKTVDLPANTYRVSVFVRDAQGQNQGYLGNVILKNSGE